MKSLKSRLTVFALSLLFSQQIQADTVVLENENLQVVFNRRNGVIERLIRTSGDEVRFVVPELGVYALVVVEQIASG